jgi:hypothetical protein
VTEVVAVSVASYLYSIAAAVASRSFVSIAVNTLALWFDSSEGSPDKAAMTKHGGAGSRECSKDLQSLADTWKIGTAPAQASWADDQRHCKKCKLDGCIRCRYVSQNRALSKITLIFPQGPPDTVPPDKLATARGCWLASAKIAGEWGLGCIICCAMGEKGAFASFSWRGTGATQKLSSQKLEKHAGSQDHKRAAAAYFGHDLATSIAAPSVDEFVSNFERSQQGRAGEHSSKSSAITWCPMKPS